MLDDHITEAVESYGIPRGEISVERLLIELKRKEVRFNMRDYDCENWESGFLLGEYWANIYKPDILSLLALSYCAICAHEIQILDSALSRVKAKKQN